jgi:hypothetical protein
VAALIQSFIGHTAHKQALLAGLKSQQWPASFIFYGPDGVGKQTLVRALLQVANCEHSELACGVCSYCVRSLEERNELIIPLQPESKKVISVDQVREVHQQLSLRVVGDKRRFVLIDPADKLSPGAANALLKTLEEPPERTHFFLVTQRVSRLLPTLRSRSQVWGFTALSHEDMEVAGELDPVAIRWSGGSLSLAKWIQDGPGKEAIDHSLQLFYSLLCESPQDWKKNAPWFFSEDEQRELSFRIWSLALQQRAHGQNDNLEFLPADPGQLARIYESIQDLQKDVESHVDKQLALDHFYYQIREAQ